MARPLPLQANKKLVLAALNRPGGANGGFGAVSVAARPKPGSESFGEDETNKRAALPSALDADGDDDDSDEQKFGPGPAKRRRIEEERLEETKGEKEDEDEDELDAYLDSLQAEADQALSAVEAKAAAKARRTQAKARRAQEAADRRFLQQSSSALLQPATITLEDLLAAQPKLAGPAEAAAGAGNSAMDDVDSSSSANGNGEEGAAKAEKDVKKNERDEEGEGEDEEAYHRAFVEAMMANGGPSSSSSSSSSNGALQQQPQPQGQSKSLTSLLLEDGETGEDAIDYQAMQLTGETTSNPSSSNSASTGAAAAATKQQPLALADAPASSSSSSSSARGAGASNTSTAIVLVKARDEDDEDSLFRGEEWGSNGPRKSALDLLREKVSKKELKAVDHSTISYLPFNKSFYKEPKEISSMSAIDVAALRDALQIKLRGKNIPRPLLTWEQTGLPEKVTSYLQTTRGFKEPFAIQKQALPIIMSGRDLIGVAKTGSGKTLAYLLPLLRHILDQPPLDPLEASCIALIMAPSRELVTQIYSEAKKLAKQAGLTAVAVYGGAPIAEQIAALKRGAEIVVAAPGRLIDVLTLNGGRILCLKRVSFVVLDEADRMFDLGFEPQVTRILANTRPDRQTVLFSATFPQHVEALARRVLTAPIEIVVGGKSSASSDVSQFVECWGDEKAKFNRLLQLLGEWFEAGEEKDKAAAADASGAAAAAASTSYPSPNFGVGSALVFVETKEQCDLLYGQLLRHGYPSLSLHGGKEQVDRDATVVDFKKGVASILIATSVAGRGLDVPALGLVVNYCAPSHLEDYVHRVGRTGRAGKKGTAYTFLLSSSSSSSSSSSGGDAQYAADMIRALRDARQSAHITPELLALAEEHAKKVEAGEARRRASGFTHTRGFKFDETELMRQQQAKDATRKHLEVSAGLRDIAEVLAEEQEEKAAAAAAAAAAEGEDGTGSKDEDGGGEDGQEGAAKATTTAGPRSFGGAGAAASAALPPPLPLVSPPVPAAPAATAVVVAGPDPLQMAKLKARLAAAQAAASLASGSTATNPAAAAAEVAAATAAIKAAELAASAAAAQKAAAATAAAASSAGANAVATAHSAALAAAAALRQQLGALEGASSAVEHFVDEIEINEYPARARTRVLRRENVTGIQDATKAAITVKGVFVEPGKKPPAGERKLYLQIEGPSEAGVRRAKRDLLRGLEEETLRFAASSASAATAYGSGAGGPPAAGSGLYTKF